MAMVLTMAMVLVGLVFLVNPTAADEASITKELEGSNEFWLGSYKWFIINVYDSYGDLTVEDHLPEGLSYVSGSFSVNCVPTDPIIDGHVISTMVCAGDSVIRFQVLYDSGTPKGSSGEVDNIAKLMDGDYEVASCSLPLILHPYCGFSKDADLIRCGPIIELNEDVQWFFHIEVKNILDKTLYNVVVTDRLGAELEVDDEPAAYATKGTFTAVRQGNVKIEWTIGELAPGETVHLYMWISTRLKGKKQSYTSCGEYEWNSGATLKFNYGMGGVQLSAHTGQMVFYVPGPWPF
jgi:hypothetical protein